MILISVDSTEISKGFQARYTTFHELVLYPGIHIL